MASPLKPWKAPPGWKKWQIRLANVGLSTKLGPIAPPKTLKPWQRAKLKRNLERPSLGHGPAWDSMPTVQEPTGGLPVAPGSSGTVGMARSTPETMHGYVAANNRAGRVKVRDAETT